MIKRLFIGIRITPEILPLVDSLQNSLKEEFDFPGLRWVSTNLLHITLQFLGDVDTKHIPELSRSLHTAANSFDRFEVTFSEPGYFNSGKAIRTIWLGTFPSPELHKLFKAIIAVTGKQKLGRKQTYSPHITLARVSDFVTQEQNQKIRDYLSSPNKVKNSRFQISSFDLIESELTPKGPIYKTVQTFNLR